MSKSYLLPAKADLRWNRTVGVALEHLAWKRPDADAATTYNVVQRLTYLAERGRLKDFALIYAF